MVIALLRTAFRLWPFLHGRGWILRLAKLLLGHRPIRFDIGGGTFIEGTLDDYVIVWTFMCRHERDEGFQHSLALLPRDGVAFDIGAHIGIWSLLAARCAPSARVHSFEPVPQQSQRLRAHAESNGIANITINRCAVGAENGSTSFYASYEENTGTSSLVRRRNDNVEIHVGVVTLDSYIAERGIARVDVMKVDVEGAEQLVFSGARQLLSSDDAPAIFFEADDRLGDTRTVKLLLAECGYGIYRRKRSKYVPVSPDEAHQDEDLFALKPRHVAQMHHP